MKNSLIVIVLILSGLTVFGQNAAFVVVAAKGTTTVGGKSLAVGQKIAGDASVTIGQNSFIGLIHQSGNPVEFRDKGVVDLKPYHTKFAQKGKGFQEKYMDYVVNGMTAKQSAGAYQSNMSVTGSVDRAMAKNEIIIPLPEKSIILDKNLALSWLDKNESGSYTVTLRNMKEEELTVISTTKKSLVWDCNDVVMEVGQYVIVNVVDKVNNRRSNVAYLYVPTVSEREKLITEVNVFKEELDLNTPVGQLALASFLSQKQLYIQADLAYQKAVDLSGGMECFSIIQKDFQDKIVAAQ